MGAILRAENVRRRRNRIAIAAVTLMGLIALALPRFEAYATGTSGDPTPFGGAITNNYQVWDPTTSSWAPGNAMGYSEGEVAAMSIELTSGDLPASPDGDFYTLTACFTYEYLSSNTIAFGWPRRPERLAGRPAPGSAHLADRRHDPRRHPGHPDGPRAAARPAATLGVARAEEAVLTWPMS